jgi:hypothetical protein
MTLTPKQLAIIWLRISEEKEITQQFLTEQFEEFIKGEVNVCPLLHRIIYDATLSDTHEPVIGWLFDKLHTCEHKDDKPHIALLIAKRKTELKIHL